MTPETATAFPVEYPRAWLRLRRTGDQFTGFVSSDGKTWKEYGSRSLDLPATLYLGLAVTSHRADASATARFANVRVQ